MDYKLKGLSIRILKYLSKHQSNFENTFGKMHINLRFQ